MIIRDAQERLFRSHFHDRIPIPIVAYKSIPIPSRNNIFIPIPALGIRSFELVMITKNKITSHALNTVCTIIS